MKRDDITELDDELQRLDEACFEAARHSARPDFAANFEDRLRARLETADEARAESAEFVAPRARVLSIPRWGYAAAAVAALVVALAFLLPGNGKTGTVLYQEGSVDVADNQLDEGEVLATTDGYLVATLDERVRVLLNERTKLEVVSKAEIALHSGEIWVYVEPGSGDFRVSTDVGANVDVIGTSFLVDLSGSGAEVATFSGVVKFSGPGGAVEVAANNVSRYHLDEGRPLAPVAGVEEPKWASDLIARYHQASLQSYFPSTIRVAE